MKLIGLWALWASIYLGQYFAGPWYELLPNFYNAALSFTIMACVFSVYRTVWAYLYGLTALAQISLNLSDAISPLDTESFNLWVDYLNILEIMILFGVAGITGFIGYVSNWIDRGRSGRRRIANG